MVGTTLCRRGLAGAAALVLVLLPLRSSAQEPTPPEPIGPPPIAPPTEPLTPPPSPAPPPEPTTTTPEPAGHCEAKQNPSRTLGDHPFIFPAFVDSAFIATYFGLHTRVAQFELPNLPTDFGILSLDAVSFSESFDFGLEILPWLGVFANIGGHSLVSTNLKSFVYEGATFGYGGNVGAILRLLRIDSTGTQLSARGSAGYSRGQLASLAPLFASADAKVALRDILQGNLGESLRTPIRGASAGGALAVAQGFGSMVGLQGVAGLGWASSTIEQWDPNTATRPETTSDGVTYRFGATASVDFAPLHVPIALMGEYLLSRQAVSAQVVNGAEGLDTIHTLFAGVYYSGRPDLQLGLGGGADLGLGAANAPLGSSDRPRYIFGELVFRYVW